MQLTTMKSTRQKRTRGLGYDPWVHAEDLGIEVVSTPLRTAHGLWVPDHNTIMVHSLLRFAYQRTVLAHEIGHAVHGHRDDRPKHEQQADKFAAYHLIDPGELADLYRAYSDDRQVILELGVTTRLFRSYALHHDPGQQCAVA